MKRYLSLVAVLAAFIVVTPATANAGAPVREFIPADDLTIEEGACDFPILVEVLVNNEYVISFFDDEGEVVRDIVQGRLVVRLTNTETGASVVRNISGPGVFTYSDDETILTARGNWFFWFFPGDLGPGSEGSAYINTGVSIQRITDAGFEIISETGAQEDLCATLG